MHGTGLVWSGLGWAGLDVPELGWAGLGWAGAGSRLACLGWADPYPVLFTTITMG